MQFLIYKKTIKMSRRNLNKVSERSQRECLKDIIKYHFLSFEKQSSFYLESISKTIGEYDYLVILCEYQNFIVKKYDIQYFHNHRELEVLVGLIAKYGSRTKFNSISEHMNSLPRKSTIVELESNLRKFTTIFMLNEQFGEILNYNNPSYEYFSTPKNVLKFKTNYIRNEGVGKQFLDYVKEILHFFDNKSSKSQEDLLSNFTDAFINLMHIPSEHKSVILKEHSNILKLRKPFYEFFGIDIIEKKNYLLTLYYLLFTSKSRYMMGVLQLYITSFYSFAELKTVFGFLNTNNLDKLSLLPGKELISNIWLDNPIWNKPFLEIDKDKYIYPIPTLPLTFIEQIIGNILNDDDKELYNHIKTTQFMEQKILKIFETKYPSLKIYSNLKFKVNERQYETDILIIHNNCAMIIESKGHTLTKKGRMGDEKRLEDRIEQIIEKGAEQAARLKDIILKRKKHNIFNDNRKTIGLDFSNIDEVLTLSISFEWLIFFSTIMNSLRTKFTIHESHMHCSLTEIDIIVDTLDDPEQLLYYFYKRSLLEKFRYPIKADELDLFCHFLRIGFRFIVNQEGLIDIAGEYDKHPISRYLLSKYNLALQDNDFLIKMRKKNPKKNYLNRTTFIENHIEFLTKEQCANILVTGYFKTIPYREQKFIQSKVLFQFKKLSNKFSISKFLIDNVSPNLILVAMDLAISNYDYVINQIEKNLLRKEPNNLGSIVVLYKLIKGLISIEVIKFIQQEKMGSRILCK